MRVHNRVFLSWILAGGLTRQATAKEFIWMSDVHLDLAYDARMSQESYCRNVSDLDEVYEKLMKMFDNKYLDPRLVNKPSPGKTPTSHIGEPMRMVRPDIVSVIQAFHGRYGCDSPPSLLWATLASVRNHIERFQKSDFLLVTGDFGGHYWKPMESRFRYPSLVGATGLFYNLLSRNFTSPKTKPGIQTAMDFLSSLNFNVFNISGGPAAEDDCEFLLRGKPNNAYISDEDSKRMAENICSSPAPAVKFVPEDLIIPQIIFCVGNNDHITDYNPQEDSMWNQRLYSLWKDVIVPESEKETFIKGLYYKVPIQSSPDTTVVCLNSVWWSKDKTWPTDEKTGYPLIPRDPAGQFEWLEDILKNARREEKKIVIAGHIPPSFSIFWIETFFIDEQYHDLYEVRYHELIKEYEDVVEGQYFGHFHVDSFRLQLDPLLKKPTEKNKKSKPTDYNAKEFWTGESRDVQAVYGARRKIARDRRIKSQTPFGLILLAPGVCPNHGNNPGWRLAFYNDNYEMNGKKGYKLEDYKQYYTPLYGESFKDYLSIGTFDPNHLPEFEFEYSMLEFLGISVIDPKSVNRAFFDVAHDERRLHQLWANQYVRGGSPPGFLIECVMWSKDQSDMETCLMELLDSSNSNGELYSVALSDSEPLELIVTA